MKQFTTFFLLILAATSEADIFRLDRQLQEPAIRDKCQQILALALDDDRLLPKSSSTDESRPRMFLSRNLESLENLIEDELNDFRMKRTKTSLSIDNPLEVLRQQFYKNLARRLKNQSIEKNRELLRKAGKRSLEDAKLPSKIQQREDFEENGAGRTLLDDNDRTNQNSMDELSYRT